MRGFLLVAGFAAISTTANAAPITISGNVSGVSSHWTADGSRIVTEATVTTATGDVVVSQLGGSVDGIAMRTMPGPPLLANGMLVTVTAHPDVDLSQQSYIVVDDVQPLDPIGAPFVRTGPTAAGHYLYWESGCIFVTPDSAGTTEVANGAEFPIIDMAIATWNTDTASCSYMNMKDAGSKPEEVGADYTNVIKFRDTSWCRPAVDDDPARCYNAAAAGITTATYINDGTNPRDGAIVDADVEINGVNFAISIDGVSSGPASCQAELLNTLTHELGHVHGLEHTCLAPGDPPRIDNLGNAVPECADTSDPEILLATMYNYQNCGETIKETLEDDDINAICTVYPTAKDPDTCVAAAPASSGCCSANTQPAGAMGLSGAVGLILLRRRRKSRRAT